MLIQAVTQNFGCLFVFLIFNALSFEFPIAVVFNGANFASSLNSTLVKTSFERISSALKANDSVRFVYTDLNSSFCNIGTSLSLFTQDFSQFKFVVLLEDCSCVKKLSLFLHLLGVSFVSQCDQPVLTVEGPLALIEHARGISNRKNFLVVPANAHGLTFYEKLSRQLRLKKLSVNDTFWLGNEDKSTEKELQKIFLEINHDVGNNKTTGATFILALKNPNDMYFKNVLNVARVQLKTNFDKILWIFPLLNSHVELGKLFSLKENAQVLVFAPVIGEGHGICENCALRTVVEKTFDIIQGLLEGSISSDSDCASFNRCSIDVLKMKTSHLFDEINWKRVATFNGKTLHVYPKLGEIIDNASWIPYKIAFRVPIVEYFPFVVKHQFDECYKQCPFRSTVCYGLREQGSNDTVINYADRFCCTGLTIDILTYLGNHMPYKFELYFQAEKIYGVKLNGTWNGVMNDILLGKADIAVDLVLSTDRCAVLDCSLGYIFTGFNTMTKIQGKDAQKMDSFSALVGNFRIFLSPYHIDLLITVLMIFNIFLFLIWASDKICLHYRNKRSERNDKFTLLESTSYVWATAFGRDVGDSKKPLTLTARYLASWLAFLSLIFVNVYVARLMAEIVKEQPLLPFTSLKDRKVLDNEVQVGVVKASAMEAYFHKTRDQELKQSFENIKHYLMPTFDSGKEAVKNGTLHGFIADRISLLTVIQQDVNCSLSLIGKDFSMIPIGFVFRKNWAWSQEFKLFELTMNERNASTKVWDRRFKSNSCVRHGSHSRLRIVDVSGLFMILAFGIAYCIFSLIVNNGFSFLLYWYRASKVKGNVSKDTNTHQRDDVVETSDNINL